MNEVVAGAFLYGFILLCGGVLATIVGVFIHFVLPFGLCVLVAGALIIKGACVWLVVKRLWKE